MKQPSVEQRTFIHEFRVSPDGQPATISGYAATFNTRSQDMGGWTEEIDPHAFDNVLAANPDVLSLWNHNPDYVLGRTTAKTLSLEIDARGLAYTVEPPDTQTARDLIVSMRRKDVTGSSFRFVCARDQWTDNPDGTVTRRILEFEQLIEVSPVSFPAYPSATANVRSLPDSMPSEIRSRFESRADDDKKTKSVDGESLTADCFLIVGDPDKTATWDLPWKFSTDDKIKAHLRDALGRFNQVKGVSDAQLKAAWKQLLKLCKQYGIDISNEDPNNYPKRSAETGECDCDCSQCQAGACGICSDDDCDDPFCICSNNRSRKLTESERNALALKIELRVRGVK
jgi:uncharacterized protein